MIVNTFRSGVFFISPLIDTTILYKDPHCIILELEHIHNRLDWDHGYVKLFESLFKYVDEEKDGNDYISEYDFKFIRCNRLSQFNSLFFKWSMYVHDLNPNYPVTYFDHYSEFINNENILINTGLLKTYKTYKYGFELSAKANKMYKYTHKYDIWDPKDPTYIPQSVIDQQVVYNTCSPITEENIDTFRKMVQMYIVYIHGGYDNCPKEIIDYMESYDNTLYFNPIEMKDIIESCNHDIFYKFPVQHTVYDIISFYSLIEPPLPLWVIKWWDALDIIDDTLLNLNEDDV